MIEGAVNAAATYLNVLKNGSLGTERFFVDINCNLLLLNLLDLLSKLVEYLNCLQPFVTAIIYVAYIQTGLIVGLVLITLFTWIFIASMLSRLLCILGILISLRFWSRIRVHITLGVICCLPLLLCAAILHIFRQKTSSLPLWVEAKHGEVGGVCLLALCCAIILSFITAILPALIR